MFYLKNIFIVILLLTYANKTYAHTGESEVLANQPIRFNTINHSKGLSQNWVRCIYQDDEGFMWFGASGGLNRYNGYNIETYPTGNVNVNAIVKRNNEELWICNDLGIYIYNITNDTITSFPLLKGQSALCMIQEADSTVWVGTINGLYRYTPKDEKLVIYSSESGLSNNYINTLFKDSNNNIWIGTKVGLDKYEKSTNLFTHYVASSKPDSLSGNDIMAICEDGEKRIWIGTAKDGVNLLIPNTGRFMKIADGAVVSLLIDSKNKLWIGKSSNGGIEQIDLNTFSIDKRPDTKLIKTNSTDPNSLCDNSIFCIYEDGLKDIWIGTFGGGVSYFSYRGKKFFSVKEGINTEPALANNLVNAIWDEDAYLWIGTEAGLDRFNKLTGKTEHFHYESSNLSCLASDPVYSLYKDSKGNFWVGTWTGGLNLFNYKTNSFKQFVPGKSPGSISSKNVFAICEDSNKNIWIGTIGGGLNLYDYKTGTFKAYKHDPQNPATINSNIIHDIKETPNGQLLIAASGSLDILDSATGNFTHYPLSNIITDHINDRIVTFIFVDSKHNIWLGTNNGLIQFNKNIGESRIFTANDGLAGNTIQGIEEDSHGNLWIGTNNGLSKFINAIEKPDTTNFLNFDETDGLSGNDFKRRAVFKNKSGQIFFGTSQGFSYFHPDSIVMNNIPPKVVFDEMQLLQFETGKDPSEKFQVRNINSIKKIELPYNKSDFLIVSSILNYLNSSRNNYKYMLEGYDPSWVSNGIHRTATYKNLKPGKYVLKVLGSNNDGAWSTSPKTLQIIINPPFWETWLFRVAIVLIISGIILLIFYWRLHTIQKEKNKLAMLVADKTKDLIEANVKLEEQSEELSAQNEELKQNQKKLSLYKDKLEELVIKRTIELEKAKNKAEESDRLKSAFLANMSHEIRTPLNAITGFALLYDNQNISDENRKRYYNIIQANTKHLLLLIEDILDLSSIQTNQVKIKNSNFLPSKVLKNIYEQFRPQASEKVEFRLNIDANIYSVFILSDERRFNQIITNLVSNAFKFTEKGSIEMGSYFDSNMQPVFYVKDTGIGISKEEQEIVFDHFTKIEKASRFFRGAGLGLALCKQLTKLLGGKIWVESEIGKGSTFYLTVSNNTVPTNGR